MHPFVAELIEWHPFVRVYRVAPIYFAAYFSSHIFPKEYLFETGLIA